MKVPIKASIKHLQINQANNLMFIVVAVAAVLVTFCLLSAKTLLGQSSFQHKVLSADKKAINDLKDNVSSANTLSTQYSSFENENPNIIGGQGGIGTTANGPSDGDNARIVLDALPDQYDFPALTSSLEKILTNDHVGVQGIGGSDQSASIGTGASEGQTSQPQAMNFSITAETDYSTSDTLIKDFERSIRPFDITSLVLSGTSADMNVNIQANTFFQPPVSLQINTKEIRE